LQGIFTRLWDARVQGWENLPADGAVLIVGNHPSYLDPIGLWAFCPRRISFMTWEAAFRVTILRIPLVWSSAFPVDTDRHDSSAVRQAIRVARRGDVMGIFPEAERSHPDGTIKPFRQVAFKMALSLDMPVVAITTQSRVWPSNRTLPRLRGRIRFWVHPPLLPKDFRGLSDPAGALCKAANRLIVSAVHRA
jgi:1-acyl-sn-glycerol-3-phosphate acyltransferase